MEESLIYDLLSSELYKYREELEKEENNMSAWVKESRENLENSLSLEQIKLVDEYKHNLFLHEEDIEMLVEIRLLNYGVKIGMQLQKFLDEEEK